MWGMDACLPWRISLPAATSDNVHAPPRLPPPPPPPPAGYNSKNSPPLKVSLQVLHILQVGRCWEGHVCWVL